MSECKCPPRRRRPKVITPKEVRNKPRDPRPSDPIKPLVPNKPKKPGSPKKPRAPRPFVPKRPKPQRKPREPRVPRDPKPKKPRIPKIPRKPAVKPRKPRRTRVRKTRKRPKTPSVPARPLVEVAEPKGIITTVHRNGVLLNQVNTNTYDLGLFTYRRSYHLVRTPNYRSLTKQQKRSLPLHPYWMREIKVSGTAASQISTGSSGTTVANWSHSGARDTFHPYAYGDTVSDEAHFKARQKLASAVNKMPINLGVALAERKQTANLIADTARRLLLAAVALRNGSLPGVYTALGIQGSISASAEKRVLRTDPSKRISTHWLEYVFGWRPLLNDVYGATEVLSGSIQNSFSSVGTRAGANHEGRRLVSTKTGSPFNGYIFESSHVRYAIRYRMDSVARAALGHVGLQNPLSVAWELLPYSFVIDWFYPVSKYLQGLMAFDGFELIDGTKSTLWKGKVLKNFDWYETDAQGYYQLSNGQSFFDEVRFDRVFVDRWPNSIRPTFRNPLDKTPLWTTLTSLALLRNLFRS